MSEEGVLGIKINLLDLIQCQDGQTMRRTMHSVSEEKLLEVLIRLVLL
tara:strand:+ start:195 stop:338 length:144 start_codon:yes stop_codon:yes gene_type:complete